jgi:hypothetical protein
MHLSRGPNDDSQNEQLDIGSVGYPNYYHTRFSNTVDQSIHHMLSLLLDNKLFLPPIEPNPQVNPFHPHLLPVAGGRRPQYGGREGA